MDKLRERHSAFCLVGAAGRTATSWWGPFSGPHQARQGFFDNLNHHIRSEWVASRPNDYLLIKSISDANKLELTLNLSLPGRLKRPTRLRAADGAVALWSAQPETILR